MRKPLASFWSLFLYSHLILYMVFCLFVWSFSAVRLFVFFGFLLSMCFGMFLELWGLSSSFAFLCCLFWPFKCPFGHQVSLGFLCWKLSDFYSYICFDILFFFFSRIYHLGCPVLHGNKWISNKWVKLLPQFKNYPCLIKNKYYSTTKV